MEVGKLSQGALESENAQRTKTKTSCCQELNPGPLAEHCEIFLCYPLNLYCKVLCVERCLSLDGSILCSQYTLTVLQEFTIHGRRVKILDLFLLLV